MNTSVKFLKYWYYVFTISIVEKKKHVHLEFCIFMPNGFALGSLWRCISNLLKKKSFPLSNRGTILAIPITEYFANYSLNCVVGSSLFFSMSTQLVQV